MWILLITKLPTEISPPKLSIHWSRADGNSKIAQDQKEQLKLDEEASPDDPYFTFYPWGLEPNYIKARAIQYKGHSIRVLPHEYKQMPSDKMRDYTQGLMGEEIPSHELVAVGPGDEALISAALKGEQQHIYDAALVDGAIHEQALLTALGVDLFAVGADYPPIGWYRCKPEYASIYCDDWEMAE